MPENLPVCGMAQKWSLNVEDGVDSGSHYLSADGTKVKDKMPEEPPPRRQKAGGP